MSLALDANILLYASDRASPLHDRARETLDGLVAGPGIVYLFWPVIIAYLRIATHPSIFDGPMSPEMARGNIEALLSVPHVVAPGEQDGFWERFREVTIDADARGNLVSDAHLVALMLQHGVRTVWSNDRDFRRFDGIEVHDPFAG
ncbi:MAG: TA system VapC family ribonuclease toxin [Actinomycetota bacterium]